MPTLTAFSFAIGLIAYLLCSASFWQDLPGWFQATLMVGCLANPLIFWLLARTLFEDNFRLCWEHAVLLTAIEALGFWYVFGLRAGDAAQSQTLVGVIAGIVLQFISVALVMAALVTAYRGRAPDLVENRRKFRVLFVTSAGGYMVFVIMVEILLRGIAPHPIASLLNAAAIFSLVFFVAVSLLTLKFNMLLEPIRVPTVAIELDVAQRALLDRLDDAIAKKAHHLEKLTIGRLAHQLGTQEHRLRALLNAKIGFRNFNDFLNHYRIPDACKKLADPSFARTPILTIALNLGYGSIGPFNRAFKQTMGLTPTEFRRRKLSDDDANSRGMTAPDPDKSD